MRLAPIALLLVLSAATAASAQTASAGTDGDLPEPIATQQARFDIPFRIDPVDDPAREPVEVRLYVSGNRGQRWDYYSKVEPSRRRFQFHAGVDGEFWFLVRTLDHSGQLWPQGAAVPELRVVVDTVPPQVDLQAKRGQAGQITASWQIDETHVKPDSLLVQYRTTTDGPWQEIALDRHQNQPTNGTSQTGQVSWWAKAGSGTIQIRAEVSDLAGNLAVGHAQVTSDQPAEVAQGPVDQQPAAARSGADEQAADSWPAEQTTGGMGQYGYRNPIRGDTPAVDSQGLPTGSQIGSTPAAAAGGTDWSVSRETASQQGTPQDHRGGGFAPAGRSNGPFANRFRGPRGGDAPDANPTNVDPRDIQPQYGDPGSSQPTYDDAGTGGFGSGGYSETAQPPYGPVTSNVNPPFRSQYVAPAEPAARPLGSQPTAGQQPQMVNSLAFPLVYDLASVGPSGVSRVELWGTQDGGQTWRLLAVDDDNRSPLLVHLQQEGIYGLKVVVTDGAGLGGGAPQPGELPEMLVGVDLTRPTAQITAAAHGSGAESGSLVICWEADDQRLAPRPISLLLSEQPRGPWSTIAAGLENTGRYAWPIDPRGPQQIYLRLEVRDEAGNVTASDTAQPVALARPLPTAQARDAWPQQQPDQSSAGRFHLP